jgi:hypothetical protein
MLLLSSWRGREPNLADFVGGLGAKSGLDLDQPPEPLRLERPAGNAAPGVLTPGGGLPARALAAPGLHGLEQQRLRDGHVRESGGGPGLLPGAALLGLDSLLRAELPGRRGLSLPVPLGHRRRLHQSEQQLGPLLPRAALQRQSQLHYREHEEAHRQGRSPVLRRRRGLCRVPLRLGHIRAVAEL